MKAIPLPQEQATMPLWPDVGQILGLGRSATYDAAARGEIPAGAWTPARAFGTRFVDGLPGVIASPVG